MDKYLEIYFHYYPFVNPSLQLFLVNNRKNMIDFDSYENKFGTLTLNPNLSMSQQLSKNEDSVTKSQPIHSTKLSTEQCSNCNNYIRSLEDHIDDLRSQIDVLTKSLSVETEVRHLHTNAIEFLLKEVV